MKDRAPNGPCQCAAYPFPHRPGGGPCATDPNGPMCCGHPMVVTEHYCPTYGYDNHYVCQQCGDNY